MLTVFLDIIYAILLVVLSPLVLYRMVREGRYRSGWGERFGSVPEREGGQRCVWIHAVSMGEINAIGSIVSGLKERLGDCEIVISTTTDTGMKRARKLYGANHKVFFYPLDFSFAVRRALGRIRPDVCVLMELEVWPNFMAVVGRRGVSVVVANGRISSGKGFPRYKRIAPLVRRVFRHLSLVLAQDEAYAERFAYLGVPYERIKVVGSLKYDTAEVVDRVSGTEELAVSLGFDGGGRTLVAGSTGPGEEEIILRVFHELRGDKELRRLRLVVVPRKPERFDEVARLIEGAGDKLVRYSLIKEEGREVTAADADAVILGDTMGDLRKFYSLADVVFVGRSLVPMGGSDMMEAAALGKPVIVGPYTENFTETVGKLMAARGIEMVADGRQLVGVVSKLLKDKEFAGAMGRQAREVIIENQGATEKTVEEIAGVLET